MIQIIRCFVFDQLEIPNSQTLKNVGMSMTKLFFNVSVSVASVVIDW